MTDDDIIATLADAVWLHAKQSPAEALAALRAAGYDIVPTPDCLAVVHRGNPVYSGPHKPHLFVYGPDNMYTGNCGGRP